MPLNSGLITVSNPMKRCLILEDNPVNQMAAQNIADKLGFAVTLCSNGAEGLDYCRTNPMPDLILLDGFMPQMNGLEFLCQLQDLPHKEKAFIIFCSSSMDRDDTDEALRIGAHCHIPKPLEIESLAQILKQNNRA